MKAAPSATTSFDSNKRIPYTFPCGHTFCGDCVSNLLKEGKHTCPTCSHKYVSDKLSKNFTIMTLSAKLKRIYEHYNAGD